MPPEADFYLCALEALSKMTDVKSGRPRGVLPSYTTDELVVLSKASPRVRVTYELKLTQYMAASNGLNFVLAVPPGAVVAREVMTRLEEHGGRLHREAMPHYSVYIGHAKLDGSEDGWVLGDQDTLKAVVQALRIGRLSQRFALGAVWAHEELQEFASDWSAERFEIQNIDGEDVRHAVDSLVRQASREGGTVFIE
jgi:hypothetical protein